MPNKAVKPRGRNGGRRPTIDSDGKPAERVGVYLPAAAVRELESRGRPGAVARELILTGLKKTEPV